MNCPICQLPIGGSVELCCGGSVGYILNLSVAENIEGVGYCLGHASCEYVPESAKAQEDE